MTLYLNKVNLIWINGPLCCSLRFHQHFIKLRDYLVIERRLEPGGVLPYVGRIESDITESPLHDEQILIAPAQTLVFSESLIVFDAEVYGTPYIRNGYFVSHIE